MKYRQDIVTRMPVTRVALVTISIVTVRSIWHNSAANFLHFGKFRTQICNSCGAIYQWNYETFSTFYRISLPYPFLMWKACYRQTLRPLVGPMCVLFVVFLANFKSDLQCSCLNVLICLELRDVFQIVFLVSQREHYIFVEGVDWCHVFLHKEGTSLPCGWNW